MDRGNMKAKAKTNLKKNCFFVVLIIKKEATVLMIMRLNLNF